MKSYLKNQILSRIYQVPLAFTSIKWTELITNGSFDSDLSGWVNDNNYWTWSSDGAVHALGSAFNKLSQAIDIAGKEIFISFKVRDISGTAGLRCQFRDAGTGAITSVIPYSDGGGDAPAITEPGHYTWKGTAPADAAYISFARDGISQTLYAVIDDVSVKVKEVPVAPSGYDFKVLSYTGTGANLSITGAGFQPDLVWTKCSSIVKNHVMFDVVRGVGWRLYPNLANVEAYSATDLTSFDSDGFSLGTSATVNDLSDTFLAVCMQAGQTGFTDNGSGLAQTEKYSDYLSIIRYTGNATAGRVLKHSLGVAPKLVICKNIDQSGDWLVLHSALTGTDFLRFNQNYATAASAAVWNDTDPDSQYITLGTANALNQSGQECICYAFAELSGYVKVGSYTGNGTGTGPYVNCGFQPSFIIIKNADSAVSWLMLSAETLWKDLYVDTDGAVGTTTMVTVDSTGFQAVVLNSTVNQSGAEMTYIAFK